jgi:hypothetical protein
VTLDAQIAAQDVVVDDLGKRVDQTDSMIAAATKHDRTRAAATIIAEQEARPDLERQREIEASKLSELKAARAGADAQKRTVEASFGAITYVATLVGRPADVLLRWFIVLVAVLIDASAVTLVYAATHRRPSASTQ